MVTFFVSVHEKETDAALRLTIESVRRFGKVVVHFDRPELLRSWVKELVDDVVFINGLGLGRSWAYENIDDDYVCTVDSHIYMFRFKPEGFCDYKRYDYGFDVEDKPWVIKDIGTKHFGQLNWNRRFGSWVFECTEKWYSYNPLVCLPRHIVKKLRDVYSKYGFRVIPWRGWGSDQEQVSVSAVRLFGGARCVNELTYAHRATVSNTEHPFWKDRWSGDYLNEWYQANSCFLKLHYPRELWKFAPFNPEWCRYVDDETVKRMQDEFRYSYWDFLKNSWSLLDEKDKKIAEDELKYVSRNSLV